MDITIAIIAFIQSLCAAFDLFLFKRQRSKTQLFLMSVWNRIDEIEEKNIVSKAAEKITAFYIKIIGKKLISVRSFSCVVCWTMSLLFISFTGYLIVLLGYHNTINLWNTGPFKVYFWSILFWSLFGGLITSLPSVLFTIYIIKSIRKKSLFISPLLILTSLFFSLIMSSINFEIVFHYGMGMGSKFSFERSFEIIKMLPNFLTFNLHGHEEVAALMAIDVCQASCRL